MFHPNVLPEVYAVQGHRGEVHPAVYAVVEHGETLARTLPAVRRPEVLRVTGLTVGRVTVQTGSSRGESIAVMTGLFNGQDRPALIAAFKSGEASTVTGPVNVAGFLAWDGLTTPKAPRRPDAPVKPASEAVESVGPAKAPEAPRPDPKRLAASLARAMADDASEDDIHIAVADQLRASERAGLFWFHPANGGHRSAGAAAKFKALGVKPGVPDLVVIIAGKVHALELKRTKGGTVSPEQREAHASLTSAGAVVAVANGYQQAIEQLQAWGAIPT